MSDYTYQRNINRLRANRPDYSQYLNGLTGKRGDDGLILPNASEGLPGGLTWVRLLGEREAVPVVNMAMSPYTADFPVETAINRRTGQREILGVLREAFERFSVDEVLRGSSTTPSNVQASDLLPGRVEPTAPPSLSVYIRPFLYDGTRYGGVNYSLASVESGLSSATQAMSVLAFDTDTRTFSLTTGDEHALAYPLTGVSGMDEAALIPTAAGLIRLAGIIVADGQTAIQSTDIIELRELLGLPGRGGSDAWFLNEDLTPQIDGSETTFTFAETFIATSTAIYQNGTRLRINSDYTEGGTFDSVTLVAAPLVGDDLIANGLRA